MKLGIGYSLNNPGHIRLSPSKFQGLAPVQSDRRFFMFTDAVWGIRAMCVILITYQDKYGIRTILDAIHRYAPPSDNNPSTAYAQFVARWAGLDTGGIINFHDYRYLRKIVEGMIQFELGGQPYTPAQLDKGLALAGVLPIAKPLAKSQTIQASTIGVAGGVTATATGVVSQLAPNLYYLQPVLEMVKDNGATLAIIGGLVLIGLFGWIAYRRWDDKRRLAH